MGWVEIKLKSDGSYVRVSGLESVRAGDIIRFIKEFPDGEFKPTGWNNHFEFEAQTDVFFNEVTNKNWINLIGIKEDGTRSPEPFGFDVDELKERLKL